MRTTRYRVGGGGGSGTPTECTPTAVFAETFGMDDFLQIIYGVNWPDSFAVTEGALGVKVKLFDTLGMDDRLTLVRQVTSFVDTFGITEGALGIAVKLFETLGADDRLSFVDLLTTYADSFGMDDRLTLAQVVTVYADTIGITDGVSFVDLFSVQLDTFALTEDALGVKTGLFDTFAHTDDLVPDLEAIWAEETIHYFNYKGGSIGPPEALEIADSATVSITGDIDIAIAWVEADWSPAGFPRAVTKWGAAGQRSWNLEFDGLGAGAPTFVWTTAGTTTVTTTMNCDAAAGFADGTIGAIRITLDVADGANKTIKYYKRTLTSREVADGALVGPLSDWTQLGTTQTEAGNTSIFDSTAAIAFGSDAGGINPTDKQILGFAMRNGIEGTLVVDYRAADATTPFQTVNERANSLPVTQTFASRGGIRSSYGPVLGFNDAMNHVTVANWTCGRSATPDTDPCGDGWIDQASTGTNHGNENPLLAKGKSTLANDERKAVIKFNLTTARLSGLLAYVGGSHFFRLQVTNTSVLLAVDVTLTLRRDDANPFTESTLTWNTPTAGGPVGDALIKSQVTNFGAGVSGPAFLQLTDAQLDDLLGDWGILTVTTPTAAAPITVEVVSREAAVAALPPRMNLELRR